MLLFFSLLFLLLSALFSGTEIAFVSANKLRIELKKKKRASRGQILAQFYERPSDFISTMLVGNTIVLVIFTYLTTILLTPLLQTIITDEFLLLFSITIVTTIIILFFGEFIPKTIFRLYADDILYFLAYPIKFFQILLVIPAWITTKMAEAVLRLFVRNLPEDSDSAFTRTDLEHFVNMSSGNNRDIPDVVDRELFGKALNLKDLRVRDCMVPRPEIEYIDLNASVQELEILFRETRLSRIIVIDGEIDDVVGYVHHQQLLREPRSIKSIIMDIPFVPEAMRVSDLLSRFIKERKNIACVVDEFGGLAGIITLEDVIEELFGEIEDEHDEEEYIEQQLSPDEYLFSGRLEIDYLNHKYPDLQLPEGEYHTLSGYLVMTTETIPEADAEIELGDYRFILESVSETKIDTVRVLRLPKED